MKKYKLLASLGLLFVLAGAAYAGTKYYPESSNGTAVPETYGGFKYSTSGFVVDGGTINAGGGITIYGAMFSSGTVDDRVDIFVTTAAASSNPHTRKVMSIYNVGNSTSSQAGSQARGFSPAGNIRIDQDFVMWKPRDSSNPMITLLFEGGKNLDSGGN